MTLSIYLDDPVERVYGEPAALAVFVHEDHGQIVSSDCKKGHVTHELCHCHCYEERKGDIMDLLPLE